MQEEHDESHANITDEADKSSPYPTETSNSQALEPITPERRPGPRMTQAERDLLLKLLVAGQRLSLIIQAFTALGYEPPASSSISYYRAAWADLIQEAKQRRTEQALTEGLALKAERVAALKDHAELLEAMRFTPDRNGRLWNERAWRQTIEDIAIEMGERKPKEKGEGTGEVVKIIIGIDPDKV